MTETRLFNAANLLTAILNSIYDTALEVDYIKVVTEAGSSRQDHPVF